MQYVDTLSLNESSVQKQIPNCVQENQEKTVFKVKPSYSVTSKDIPADLLRCCVSVPRVPALWMVGDWLHLVSHTVLEDSQNRPPTPITWGILHKLKLCVRRSLSQPMSFSFLFFFFFFFIDLGVRLVSEFIKFSSYADIFINYTQKICFTLQLSNKVIAVPDLQKWL